MQPDRRKPEVPPPPDEDDVYGLAEPPPPASRLPAEPLVPLRKPALADEARPPPAIPLVSGVFNFPWRLDTFGPWGLMSMGLSLAFLGVVFCIWLVDIGLTIAARCFAAPVFCVAYLTVTYASQSMLVILQETAAGNDKIDEWPSGDWREWFWSLRFVGGAAIVAALLAAAVNWVTLRVSWWPGIVVAFVAYPFVLLSSLETASPLVPLSRPVARSLKTVWWGWLALYATSGLMVGALALAVVSSFPWSPFATAALAGPPLAAILMIYARLLGRLAWLAQKQDEDDDS
ncbi:MAG: hypothetical protein NUV77_00265 [Thermoguttaceae bacterium]|nr:hypothetical protein [Thermoguttaceae bacterium]